MVSHRVQTVLERSCTHGDSAAHALPDGRCAVPYRRDPTAHAVTNRSDPAANRAAHGRQTATDGADSASDGTTNATCGLFRGLVLFAHW